jgi:hypothetical protein
MPARLPGPLRNSGNLRLLRDADLATEISDVDAAPGPLFPQVDRLRGKYPVVLQEILPPSRKSCRPTCSRTRMRCAGIAIARTR